MSLPYASATSGDAALPEAIARAERAEAAGRRTAVLYQQAVAKHAQCLQAAIDVCDAEVARLRRERDENDRTLEAAYREGYRAAILDVSFALCRPEWPVNGAETGNRLMARAAAMADAAWMESETRRRTTP